MSKTLLIVLGNQLFPRRYLAGLKAGRVFMAEDVGLCTHYRYHKHKLILFLAAMRAYAEELSAGGLDVDYRRLSATAKDEPYESKLASAIARYRPDELVTFEVEDKFFETRLRELAQKQKLELRTIQTPMFLTSREDFSDYLRASRRPFMKTFYERQRSRLGLLMESGSKPAGGRFSFDTENRRPLPKQVEPPLPPAIAPTAIVQDVCELVEKRFGDHPGKASEFWLPTTRRQALGWMSDFVDRRLERFGPYEDAIPLGKPFVYHSVLSPLLNLGLITPEELVRKVIAAGQERSIPIESLEGFVRQVIGWREFIRGIYQNYSEKQEERNFWKHKRKLTDAWYRGDTGVPILDHVIQSVVQRGWCHHIQRLMVLSNLMLLCEVDPHEAHRWFMEMFVDSSDWVMGPNVYGMGQLSDGGIFATKPYLCGSNYLRKMAGLPRGPWCDVVDGLYWSFIDKHRNYFSRNPRTSFIPLNLDRLRSARRQQLFAAAREFRERMTREA